jgi:ABC-type multidrug transport system fused ATPase/permease subunit
VEIPLTALLKNINLTIQRGKFYMIFGDIGAGKSTLLLSILNEMKKEKDTQVMVNGKLAYVSQKPWVMCESLENNISFTLNKDRERLQRVFEAACLLDDIKVLPDG